MPYRLSRSLLLWLGLPGFLFILWAWHDSLTHETGIARSYSQNNGAGVTVTSSDFIGQTQAAVIIQWHLLSPSERGMLVTSGPTSVRNFRPPPPESGWKTIFPGRRDGMSDRRFPHLTTKLRRILIPHWQILFWYTAAWVGGIAWRRHRARKLMAPAEAENGDGLPVG